MLDLLACWQAGAHCEVVWAEALLMGADGDTDAAIDVSASASASVKSWRDRFAEEGLAKVGQVL